MNQTKAESVKDLAKPMVEALEVITERKCSEWMTHTKQKHNRGEGSYTTFTCETCNGTGKVRWKWEPKVGEWVIYRDACGLIVKYWPITTANKFDSIEVEFPRADKIALEERVSQFIPILHWETIERVLEGAGYWLKIERLPFNGSRAMIGQLPKDYQVENWINGKSRQEAVMKVVIKLGEEKNG